MNLTMGVTTADTVTGHEPFANRLLLHGCLAWYLSLWIFLAIDPVNRQDWALENILAVGLVMVLFATYRRFPLSDLSYLLITVFMTLHAIGSHYTYSKVPMGFWMEDWWGLERNHFDRIAHFSFGLLLVYPLRELYLRVVQVRGFWSYYLPVSGILAMSGFFEILESWVVLMVHPELGEAYLGTQGDEWDAQKDMTLALVGGFLTIILTYGFSQWGSQKDR